MSFVKTNVLHDGLKVGQSAAREKLLASLLGGAFDLIDRLTYDERCSRAYGLLRLLNELGFSARSLWNRPLDLAAFQELTSVVDPTLSMLVAVHHFLSFGAIRTCAPNRHDLEPEFEAIDALDQVGTFVITECGYGNSHAHLETIVNYDSDKDELVLHTPSPTARKIMSANSLAGVAKAGVVISRLRLHGQDCGIFPVLVPLRDERELAQGIEIEALPESSQVPMDYASLNFEHVRVPSSHLLHPDPLSVLRDGIVSPERQNGISLDLRQNVWMAFALQLSAVGRASVTIAIRHAIRRMVWPQPAAAVPVAVANFKSHNEPLLRALATACATTALVNRAKTAWAARITPDAGVLTSDSACGTIHDAAWTSDTQLGRTLSLVRLIAAQQTTTVTGMCMRRLGASGVFDANRIAAYHGLSNILHPAAGDAHLTALAAMREIGSKVHYAAPQTGPPPNVADFSEPGFWTWLLSCRERLLHQELQQSVRTEPEREECWDSISRLGIRTVEAHVQRLQMDAFYDMATGAKQQAPGLSLLLVLHGIEIVGQDQGWYVAQGLMTLEQLMGLEQLGDRICGQLVPQMPAIVALFDLPNTLLRADVLLERDRSSHDSIPVPKSRL